mgnify:CR=1 FL=1
MKYYREIDLDNFEIIQEKLLKYAGSVLESKTIETVGFYPIYKHQKLLSDIPELQQSFDKYDLKIKTIAFYISNKPTTDYVSADEPLKKMAHTVKNPIHADVSVHQARINLPILNTKGTYTRFFTNCKLKSCVNPFTGTPFILVTNKDYIEVDAVEIVKPTVVKITEPHIVQIYEGSVLPRITLTIGFETDPAYLLEQ